jgi:glycosyltransferase involved in cell wall biosynthesis
VGLLSRRFDVTVVSGTARPKPAVLRRVRYLRWGALGSRFKPIEWLRLLAGARHVRRLLERADIVYIPSHTLLPLAAAAKRLRPGVKVVVHLHNFQPLAYTSVLLADGGPGAAQDFLVERMEHGSLPRALAAGLGHYANRAVGLLALSCADAVVCVSRRQRDILLRYIPGLRGKTAVIYNPPPPLPGAGKELGGEPVLVYAGGSSYVKGFHVLLELFREAARGGARRPCRFYVVAGRGSEGPLKALSAALGGRLVARMERDGRLGAIQPVVVNRDGTLNLGGAVGLSGLPKLRTSPSIRLSHLSGAALMVRASAFFGAGMFDESLFLYHGDVEFCWRLPASGSSEPTIPSSTTSRSLMPNRKIARGFLGVSTSSGCSRRDPRS